MRVGEPLLLKKPPPVVSPEKLPLALPAVMVKPSRSAELSVPLPVTTW